MPGMQEVLGLIPSTSNKTSQNSFQLILSHILDKPVPSVVNTRQHPQVRRCCLETPTLPSLCLWYENSLDQGRPLNTTAASRCSHSTQDPSICLDGPISFPSLIWASSNSLPSLSGFRDGWWEAHRTGRHRLASGMTRIEGRRDRL